MSEDTPITWSCPIDSSAATPKILLTHGGGGRAARQLLRQTVLPRLHIQAADFADAATLTPQSTRLAFATDAFIVSPIFFPGGDIGSLAVHGTANDLIVAGAAPRWLSLSLVIEEGLPTDQLETILDSVTRTAREIEISIVTGDTKVAPKGTLDKLFLTTAGVGEYINPVPPGPASLTPGDVLMATGPIGRHGIAILCCREQIDFDPPPTSDLGSLWPAAQALRNANIRVRAMRDCTRGGLAAVLHEWAQSSAQTLTVREADLPVSSDVRGACELLGLDPIFLACEGTMLVALDARDADAALKALHANAIAPHATIVGRVQSLGIAPVVLETTHGPVRPLDEPLMPEMPRIC